MNTFFSTVTPAQKMVNNIGTIHDSNEDILRIIKLYNHGTTKNIDEESNSSIRYPHMLRYRSSNLYIIITAAFSVFTSVCI